MTRKVIQLAVAEGYYSHNTMALCDDGTVWQLSHSAAVKGGWYWKRIPPIPEDEPDNDTVVE